MSEPTNPKGLQLFNTLTGKLEAFVPLDPAGKQVKMYVCGPTVYDDAHLGHARCYITWDVLYRFLKFLGYDVTYVRNVTDVDDKILNRARERGESPSEVAERNYQSFAADMQALNVLPPDAEPRATQYIPQMIESIQGLVDKGAAYVTPEGTVYFRVEAKADYGKLSKKPLDDLKSGARVEVDPHKESPLDFALWKHVSAEEQAQPGHAFDSPWGKGRPGWHIECSAMNFACLGPQIDIHAGGADLIFPHHENEIAQTEAWLNLTGDRENTRFSKYWMHNGFVNVSGEKMSKSLGNFSTIKKLLILYDANSIRCFLLINNYRMPVDFNREALMSASTWVSRNSKRLRDIQKELNISKKEIIVWALTPLSEYSGEYINSFITAMSKDLNTSEVLATIGAAIKRLRINAEAGEIERKDIFKQITIMLYVLGFNIASWFGPLPNLGRLEDQDEDYKFYPTKDIDIELQRLKENFQEQAQRLKEQAQEKVTLPQDEIRTIYREMTGEWMAPDIAPEECLKTIVQMRKRAKEIKNWTQADAIRKHLTDIGLQLLDNKDGTTSVEKDGLEVVRV